jgi:tetratricopeptide (TPR) repeat protein
MVRLGAAIILLVSLAHADTNKDQARAFFRSATQHYDLSEFAEALHDFKEAYRNYEEPTFLFNIAQCHRLLGQKEPAVRFYKVYLSKVPNAVNKAEVRDLIAKLELAIADERKAQATPPHGTIQSKLPPPEPSPMPVASPAPSLAVVVAPAPSPAPKADKPVYKKWWLWTAVVVVVGAGVGIGLGLGLSQPPSAHTDFGTYKPF